MLFFFGCDDRKDPQKPEIIRVQRRINSGGRKINSVHLNTNNFKWKKDRTKKFIPVMLTPFKDNGEIDFDGLTRLTEMYLQAGVKGLFANCQSSEMFELSNDEKLRIVKHVMKITTGRVPVIAVGNFGKTIAGQADFIKKIYDTGVQAAIIVTSLIASENEQPEIFEEKVFQLFELTGKIPLGFYECPEPYKRILTAEQLKKFVATGRVIYHKDTCLDIALVKEKLEATNAIHFFWPVRCICNKCC